MAETPLLVGIGSAGVDLVGVAPRSPEPEGHVQLMAVSLQGGGAVANALVAARALGCRARIAGHVAGDDFGRFAARSLREAGVDCEHLRTAPGVMSPFAFVAVAAESRRRAVYATAGDVAPLAADDLDLTALLDDARLLLLDGEHAAAQVVAAEEARDRGIPVLVDASVLMGGTGELLALADILVASERLVAEIAPRGEAEDSLVELQAMGPRTVVITQGAAGSIGLAGDQLVRQPAHPVDVVDTSGAGDVYAGALAAALARGLPLERAMQMASAAAALSCRALGARAAVPDAEELAAFLGWGGLDA